MAAPMVTVYVISAFSKEKHGGNRAGVVLDSRNLTAMEMAAAAKNFILKLPFCWIPRLRILEYGISRRQVRFHCADTLP